MDDKKKPKLGEAEMATIKKSKKKRKSRLDEIMGEIQRGRKAKK